MYSSRKQEYPKYIGQKGEIPAGPGQPIATKWLLVGYTIIVLVKRSDIQTRVKSIYQFVNFSRWITVGTMK